MRKKILFFVLMRQGMDEVSNTFFFSLTNHCQSTRWMVRWWRTTLELFLFYSFIFLYFHVDPPLCHWDPSSITVLLAERYLIPPSVLRFMIIISLACGEIGDLEIVWWTLSIWKPDSGGARGRAAPDIQPDQWFKPSDWHFHPLIPQCSQLRGLKFKIFDLLYGWTLMVKY